MRIRGWTGHRVEGRTSGTGMSCWTSAPACDFTPWRSDGVFRLSAMRVIDDVGLTGITEVVREWILLSSTIPARALTFIIVSWALLCP